MIGIGNAVRVVLLLLNGEGPQMPFARCLEILLLLGDDAQLVIADGGAVQVALLF